MAEEKSVPSLKTYRGNCNCGAFRYSVKLPPFEEVTACNCSICAKKSYLWSFPISADVFVVEKGDGTLKSYEFGRKKMMHKCCPECGTAVMGQMHGGPDIGLNVRTIQDLDLDKLKKRTHDGAAIEPAYDAPVGPKPSIADASKQSYRGSCHCGKVTFELQSEPLNDLEVTDCNCNICARNGYLWIYPSSDAVQLQGEESLRHHSRYYKSDDKVAGHGFCFTCGVFVLNKLGPEAHPGIMPINVRAINGVNLDGLKIKKHDGKTLTGKPYVLDE
ncbi:hypothetical protein ABVK25_004803 [Lepraria finkii]|uniref:CENP-V/GFA domain-containing protein n=1 Tax=Lepraria finkii TaxID=1340010 RepID=A0ABR4BD66_9LECA